jgi:hypothetical protein
MQAIINMGVNVGLLPTKGITLPFMSYGGSSLIVCCIAIGLLMRIHYETCGAIKQAKRQPSRAPRVKSRSKNKSTALISKATSRSIRSSSVSAGRARS